MNDKIGIFDSGIGGLTVLEEIKKILPNENYIYYADSKNNPYGEKKLEDLIKIVSNIVDLLISKNVKMIVIACNTATTKCINILREKYPNMTFVGTEPAIKVACDKNFKNTLVMATPGTVDAERTHELVKNNKKKNQKITLLACSGLADAIEFGNETTIKNKVHKLLKDYKNENIDCIVLGCTHYPHAKRFIQKEFPNATLVDGNKGVAKRVQYLLETNNMLNKSNNAGTIEMIFNK